MINFNSFYFSIIHVFGVESFRIIHVFGVESWQVFLKVHMFLTLNQIEY